ncbi:MAG: polyphosphate kinase 1 [Phycisphaerales bacterium]|nr:polyphosphate kinase 1 [Phycisphaerales bacterium]
MKRNRIQRDPVSADAGSTTTSGTAMTPLTNPARFLNRDFEWLEFNRRVLDMSGDAGVPLLERIRFLCIFSSNLDEFFMKRVGSLRHQIEAGLAGPVVEALTPAQQFAGIRERVMIMANTQANMLKTDLYPALRAHNIELLKWNELNIEEQNEARKWFRHNVFPILTPLAVDPGHRFPFISNMSVSLGVMLQRPGESEQLFARVKVPEIPSRLYRVPGTRRWIPLQDIIEHNLDELFPGMEILKVLPFRVTRNAEIDNDNDDADDLLEAIQQQLRERRFARVVRMEIPTNANPRILKFLMDELEIDEADIYESDGVLDYGALNEIADVDDANLHFSTWIPLKPLGFDHGNYDIFARIRKGDVLLHHPYESFEASVEQFIEQAAKDPKVLCIKQSLYRTSGDSPFITSLIHAAETGKQVAVLVELRARFDEARNIRWARKLEDAGVHVAYGVVGLKTHTKTALVVRQEATGIRCYGHIGTGNYNSKTARLYEDIGLLTCDPEITEDLTGLFNYMTGRSRQRDYLKLLIAPVAMKKRFLQLIENEIELTKPGKPGRIIAKMNQLEDRGIMDALYRASQAGVQIDLIVRGFCCLRPGVPGLSDNIRVRSVVGRFLEHSRIFWFQAGKDNPLHGDMYIGSADWMYRNLQTRVEAATPILLEQHRARLWDVIQTCLNDCRQSWQMRGDGTYERVAWDHLDAQDPRAIGVHDYLMNSETHRHSQLEQPNHL